MNNRFPNGPQEAPNQPKERYTQEQLYSEAFNAIAKDFTNGEIKNIHQLEKYAIGDSNAENNVKNFFKQEIEKYISKKNLDYIVFQNDIEPIINAKLANNILQIAKKEAIKYQSLKNAVLQKSKKWFMLSGADDVTIFEDITRKMSQKDLESASVSPLAMKRIFEYNHKFLRQATPFSANAFAPKNNTKNATQIVTDLGIDIDRLNDSEKTEFMDLIDNYVKTGTISPRFMKLVLKAVDKNDPNFKEKIIGVLQEFLTTISLKKLYEIGILDEDAKKNVFFDLCQEYKKSLSSHSLPAEFSPTSASMVDVNSDAFKEFESTALTSDSIFIDTNKLDSTKIATAISDNDEANRVIGDLIEQEMDWLKDLEENANELIKNSDDMKVFLTHKIANNSHLHAKIPNDPTRLAERIIDNNYLDIRFNDDKQGIWKIKNIDAKNSSQKWGITVTKMLPNTTSFDWEEKESYFFSYDEWVDLIMKRLEDSDVQSLDVSSNLPFVPSHQEILGMNTIAELNEVVNDLDPDGEVHWFAPGLIFSLKDGKDSEFVELYSIDETANPKTLTMKMFDGSMVTVDWTTFIERTEEQFEMKRLWNITSPQDFAEKAKFMNENGNLESFAGMKWNNTKRQIDIASDSGEDEKIWGFSHPDNNTFAETTFNNDGTVNLEITQFIAREKTGKKIEEPEKNEKNPNPHFAHKAANKQRIKVISGKKKMSYTKMLQMLQKYGMTIPIAGKNPVGIRADEIKKEDGNYMKNRAHGGKPGVWTIGDLIYMTKSGIDLFKKKREFKSEVKTAYAMINAPVKSLRVPGRDAFGRIVDATVDDVRKKYAGVARRKWIRDILGQTNPKPHEILAAIMLVYEMTGTLYPDSYLQDLQWEKYLWFEKIAIALGLNPQDQLKLAAPKVYESNPGVFDRKRLPEEELIKTMFKMNQETNGYIQAVWGGAKIWKMAWKWRSEQEEKGRNEVKEEASTAIGRADYAVKKMESNEFEIALGALDGIFGKSFDNDVMGVMFTMVMWWAPGYVHHEVTDKFLWKTFAGYPFHAFHFSKWKESADLYFNAVSIAVWASDNTAMKRDFDRVLLHKPQDDFAHNWDYYAELWKFWKKYHSELHSVLQGTNPVLQVMLFDSSVSVENKNTITKYLKQLSKHANIDNTVSKYGSFSDFSTNGMYSKWESPYYKTINGNHAFRSLALPLSIMSINENTKEMSGAYKNGPFRKEVVDFFEEMRTYKAFTENPEYQKKQFRYAYDEVMKKLHSKTFPYYPNMPEEERRQTYNRALNSSLAHMKMLTKYGLRTDDYDIMSSIENIEADFENAYARFVSGVNAYKSDLIREWIHDRFESALTDNDRNYSI